MNKATLYLLIPFFIFSCKSKEKKIKPTVESISESIYASGVVKSKNQYQAFAVASGVIEDIYVEEGDSVKKGMPILSISNEAQRLNKENAQLSAAFADFNANQEKLVEAKLLIDLSMSKMKNDSVTYQRQKNLWQQGVGSKVELEQRELAYQNSKTSYYSSLVRYNDLKRQLDLASSQAKNNLSISGKLADDYILYSEIDGIVYSISKKKGEIVSPQTPVAVIGDAKKFTLEMQVDEYDILKIKKGLLVQISLDSYKGRAFEGVITKINPIMNERSKTFLVEAEFVEQPEVLYPNITFEANIILNAKDKAILIPRNYLIDDSLVIKGNGEKVLVKTGLKDYRKVEILSGITADDELIDPVK